MCEKCTDIDAKIERYRKLLADVDDPTALALFDIVIADLESEKTVLHPEPDK